MHASLGYLKRKVVTHKTKLAPVRVKSNGATAAMGALTVGHLALADAVPEDLREVPLEVGREARRQSHL